MKSWVEWGLWRRILVIALLGSAAGAVVVSLAVAIILFVSGGRPLNGAGLQGIVGVFFVGLLIAVPMALAIGLGVAIAATVGGTVGKRRSWKAELWLTAVGGGVAVLVNVAYGASIGGQVGSIGVAVVGLLATLAFTLATRNYRLARSIASRGAAGRGSRSELARKRGERAQRDA